MRSTNARIAGGLGLRLPRVLKKGACIIMRISMEELKETSLALEFETPAERFPALREMVRRSECDFMSPIRTRLRAMRAGDMVEVEGEIRTTVRLSCGRCLAEFASPLKSAFALTYTRERPAPYEPAEPDIQEMDAAEAGLIYFQGEEIDLTDGIQEQVILSLPLRPLCSEACKGLCTHCGADLNAGACRCLAEPAGGPFSVLRRLKLEKK
jgi:uncharacterized protein